MARYRFKAKNQDNQVLKGTLVAKDSDDLREIIGHHNFFIISYRRVRESSQLFAFLERVKMDELTFFCRQLSFMVGAGIEIDNAIANLKTHTQNRKMKKILEEVHHFLLEGHSLSFAFEKFPQTFPKFFVNMIAIGEASGNMEFVLKRLGEYLANEYVTQKQIKKATAYPKFLLMLILVLVMGLSVFVIPMFSELFDSFDAELPPLTVIVNTTALFIRDFYGIVLAGIFLIFVLTKVFLRTKKGRYLIDALKLYVPVIKDVTINSVAARFVNGLGVLIESGAKIIDSLEIIGQLLGNSIVEKKFQIVASEIKRGQPIGKSLETIDLFPPILIEMIKTGEDSDTFGSVLDKTAVYFEERVTTSIRKMTGMIEPLFVIIIGVMIMFVLLSVFGPMSAIMDTIGETVVD